MGTPAFMPPEQAAGRWSLVDEHTDLWALGATMFALLTGQYVHEAETVQLLMAAAMTHPARPIGSLMPTLPAAVCAIVDCALAFDREARWPDARAMQRRVQEARRGIPFALAGAVPATSPTVVSGSGNGVGAARTPGAKHEEAAMTASPVSRNPSLTGARRGGRPRAIIAALGAAVAIAAVGFAVRALSTGAAMPPAEGAASTAPSAVAEPTPPPLPASAAESTINPPAPSPAVSAAAVASAAASATARPGRPVGAKRPPPPSTGGFTPPATER